MPPQEKEKEALLLQRQVKQKTLPGTSHTALVLSASVKIAFLSREEFSRNHSQVVNTIKGDM